jgi:NCS1 family nucleobase:cation symporter-1
VAALIIGILGGVLSYFGGTGGYYANYSNFLLLLAYWISPWLAIVVTDYLMYRRKQDSVNQFYEGSGNVKAGVYAFILAIIASYPFFNQSILMGPIAKAYPQIGDISYYVSFVVAMILYAIFSRFSKNAAVQDDIKAA